MLEKWQIILSPIFKAIEYLSFIIIIHRNTLMIRLTKIEWLYKHALWHGHALHYILMEIQNCHKSYNVIHGASELNESGLENFSLLQSWHFAISCNRGCSSITSRIFCHLIYEFFSYHFKSFKRSNNVILVQPLTILSRKKKLLCSSIRQIF